MRFLFLKLFFFVGVFLHAQTDAVRYVVIPETPRQGDPVTIGVNHDSGVRTGALMSGGQRLARTVFFDVPVGGGQQPFRAAVMAVPVSAAPGRATIILEGEPGLMTEIILTIASRDFPSERIRLNRVMTGLMGPPDQQRIDESNYLLSIRNRVGAEVHAFGRFQTPTASTRRTSHFGHRRTYVYTDGRSSVSIHDGIDFGIPAGTPVQASAPGRVALARPRILTGNSILIEHVPGVYSVYYHLDRIDVEEGALVAAGNIIGLSGNTGFSTGAHLHWELRVFGHYVDPDTFIARPIIDRDAILSTIGN
ncbi:MAG: M23 family metallopeptidase [Treponema sp.]|nr:M23 family metallopeptidase [Treponema sp.]